MNDVATLVLAVDSSQVQAGEKSLDNLTSAGGRAEKATSILKSAAIAFGVAIGTAATATAIFVKANIDAADAMNDLHLRTGIAFKSLASYDLIARQSGSSIQGMAQGFKFLSRYMAEHSEKLKSIGVTSKDINVAMGQFADIIQAMEDPAKRTALAMEVLGRSGDELIPTLIAGSEGFEKAKQATKEYGEQLERAAPLADEFNDQLEDIATKAKTAGLSIAADLLPSLITTAKTINELLTTGGGNKEIRIEWLERWINTVGLKFSEFEKAWSERLSKFWSSLGQDKLAENFAAQANNAATAIENIKRKQVELDLRGWTSDLDQAGDSTRKLTKAEQDRIDALIKGKGAQDEVGKKIKEYIKSLEDETAQLGLNTKDKKWAEAAAVAITARTEQERQSVLLAAEAWITKTTAIEVATDATKRLKDQEDAYAERLNKYEEGQMDATLTLENKVRELEHEARTMNASAATLREIIILRELEKSGIDKATEAYEEYRIRLENAYSAVDFEKLKKSATDSQADMWKSIEGVAKDSFVSIFNSGKSAFDRLKDTLKNGLYALLYEMTVKKWFINVSAAVSGEDVARSAFGNSGVSGGSGGIGSLFNMGSSFFNAGGSLYNSFAMSSIGQSFGLSTAGANMAGTLGAFAGDTAMVSELTSLGSSVGAAMPYVAAAIIAADALGFFDSEQAPPEMGMRSQNYGSDPKFDANLATGKANYVASPFGILRAAAQHVGDDPAKYAAQLAEKYLKPLAAMDEAIASFLTKSQITEIRKVLDNWKPGEVEDGSGFTAQLEDRLNTITTSIGGFVKEIFDQFDTDLKNGYALTVALLHAQGREQYEALARTYAASDLAADKVATLLDNLIYVNDTLKAFNQTLYSVSEAGADASSNMLELFGGLSNFQNALAAYYDSFYTQAEKNANYIQSVSDVLGELHLSLPGDESGYRAMVDAAFNAGEAGAELYAKLIKLAPQVSTALEARRQLIASAEDDVRAAKEKLANLYEEEARNTEQLVNRLTSQVNAIKALRLGIITGGQSPLSDAGKGAYITGYYNQIAAKAREGDLDAIDKLPGALNSYIEEARNTSATQEEYLLKATDVFNTLDVVGGSAQTQLDVAKENLSYQQEQVRQLTQLNGTALTIEQAIAALAQAQSKLAGLQFNVDSLNSSALGGVTDVLNDTTTTDTVETATRTLAEATAMVDAVKGIGKNDIKKIGDLSIMAIADQLAANDSVLKGSKVKKTQLELALESALGTELSGLNKTDMKNIAQAIGLEETTIKGFASGGSHFGGLRIVGEGGMEVEATGPARYWSHKQTADFISGSNPANADMREALVQIKDELAAMRKANSDHAFVMEYQIQRTANAVNGDQEAPILTEAA